MEISPLSPTPPVSNEAAIAHWSPAFGEYKFISPGAMNDFACLRRTGFGKDLIGRTIGNESETLRSFVLESPRPDIDELAALVLRNDPDLTPPTTRLREAVGAHPLLSKGDIRIRAYPDPESGEFRHLTFVIELPQVDIEEADRLEKLLWNELRDTPGLRKVSIQILPP